MIVFLGNSGKIPEDKAVWPIVVVYALLLIGILAFASPIFYSFVWFTLMFLGIQVDWQTGFQIFWIIILVASILGSVCYVRSCRNKAIEIANYAKNVKK